MSDLAAFLLARIDEDETVAHNADGEDYWLDDGEFTFTFLHRVTPARVLAECAAKRAIIETARQIGDEPPAGWVWAETILRTLALPYADHPEFREEWRP